MVQGLSGKKLEEITAELQHDILELHSCVRHSSGLCPTQSSPRNLEVIKKVLDDIANQHRLLALVFKKANEGAIDKCVKRLEGSLGNFEVSAA